MSHCDCPNTNISMLPIKGFGIAVDTDSLPKTDLSPIEDRLEALEKELEEALSLVKTKVTYQLCEFYSFRHPQKRQGFELAHGELLENVADLYPEAWDYLQTDEGKVLCVTEDEWQAMTHATWATLADGTKVGFDGIGGAPFYVQDVNAGTLRLPDIRGMYAEATGFDGLTVGGVHGDINRKIYDKFFVRASNTSSGYMEFIITENHEEKLGLFESTYNSNSYGLGEFYTHPITKERLGLSEVTFDTSKVTPTGNANKPRAFGVLPCVYLGNSK